LLSTATLATLFSLPLAIVAGWLLWRSLDWSLVGDATIFHFIASQFQMGAVPYRDIFDINMPLIYYIHAAVVAIGGMGDVAWRAFDLTAAVIMSILILMLVWPAGRAVANGTPSHGRHAATARVERAATASRFASAH
jgi:hypothetical protein